MILEYCQNCGKEFEDINIRYYTSKSGNKYSLCEDCFNKLIKKGKIPPEEIKKFDEANLKDRSTIYVDEEKLNPKINPDIGFIIDKHREKIEEKNRIKKEWNDLDEIMAKEPAELFEEEEKLVFFDKTKYNRALASGQSEKSARVNSSIYVKDVKEKMDMSGLKIAKDNWERMKPEEKLRLVSGNSGFLRLRYFRECENILEKLINDISKAWDALDSYEKDAFAFLLHFEKNFGDVRFSKGF